jgi:hypothetical protein
MYQVGIYSRRMRTEVATDSHELALPADMLESVLRDADRMAADTAALLEPLSRQRDRMRSVLTDEGQIVTVPESSEQLTLGAIDGGYVVDQLYAADRLVVCSVVAEGMRTIRTGELHHATWTQVLAHQIDLDRLASAVMTCLELSLLRGIGYQVRIFDGSHQTPVIALNSALASANPRVRAFTAQIVRETEAVKALRLLCDDSAGARIVGLPKADSSTEFCANYRDTYSFDIPPVTDRVLATEVLERGEMLKPRKPKNWHRLHIFSRRPREDDAEQEGNPEVSEKVRQVAEELDKAIEPLRHCGETGRGIGITYLKPHRSDTCVKVEYKASAGIDHGTWLAGVLSAEVPGPHMQEPYGQFVADLWAKNISMAAEALAAATRHKMSVQRWQPYLALGYRTRAAGAHQ